MKTSNYVGFWWGPIGSHNISSDFSQSKTVTICRFSRPQITKKTRDASGRSTIHTSCCLSLHPVVPLLASDWQVYRVSFWTFFALEKSVYLKSDTRGKAAKNTRKMVFQSSILTNFQGLCSFQGV